MYLKHMARKKLITEEEVKNSIANHLSKEGWGDIRIKTSSEKGADITARKMKYSRYIYVETKGDGTKRTQAKNQGNFFSCLGQIITRITTLKKGYYYGLGLPEESAKIALRRIPSQLAIQLKIHIFSVSDERKVKEYKPSHIAKHQKE